MTLLLTQMSIILLVAVTCGRVARKLGQARVVGEIVEAKEEAGEDIGKAVVLIASFCSIDVKVARASGAGAAQVSLVATEH